MPTFHPIPLRGVSGFNPNKEVREGQVEEMMNQAREDVAKQEPTPTLPDPFVLFDPMAMGPAGSLQEEPEPSLQPPDQPTDIPAANEDPALQESERPVFKIGKYDIGSVNVEDIFPVAGKAAKAITGKDLEIGMDVGEGLNAVIGAVTDLVANTAQGIDLVTQALGAPEGALADLARRIPKVAPSDSWRTRAARSMLQFYLAFAPGLSLSRAALLSSTGGVKLAANAPLASDLLSAGAADALATWFAFDGDEPTLAETINQMAPQLKDLPYYSDIMSYISSEPGDTEAEKRWKNVLEGQIANVLIGPAFAPKRAVKEFGMLFEGVRRSQHLRRALDSAPLKYLANERGSIGGGPRDIPGGRMRPENAMPFVRGEMRDALRERDRLANLLNQASDRQKVHVQSRIDANEARIEALTASQEHHQRRIIEARAMEQVNQMEDRLGKLRQRAEAQEAKVTETAAEDLGENPAADVAKRHSNKLSRQRTKARRTQAEIGELEGRLNEAKGAAQSTIQQTEAREISIDELMEGAKVKEMRVPTILGEGPQTPVDPLSRQALPLTDEAAEWMLANKDVIDAMQKPIRDQLGERIKQFSRKGGPASVETLNKQAEELGIPINRLDDLMPGQGVSTEHLSALTGTVRDIHDRVKRASDAYANNPTDPHLEKIFDESMNDFVKVYGAFTGQDSEAGASLFAGEHFKEQLNEIGVVRLVNTIRKHGGTTTKSDKVHLAKLMSVTPKKRLGRFLNGVGDALGKEKPWGEALAEIFVSTRFTPLTLARNVISTSLMIGSDVGARILAGALTDIGFARGSDITITEGFKMAQGVLGSLKGSAKLYADMKFGFSPGIDYGNMVSKIEAPRTPAISANGFGMSPESRMRWLPNALGYGLRTLTRQMVAMDQVFQYVARGGQRQALAYREAIKDARALSSVQTMSAKELRQQVRDNYSKLMADFPRFLEDRVEAWGEYATFADQFNSRRGGIIEPFGETLVKLQRAHPLTKLLAPFVRTSIRIGQATFKRFPFLGRLMKDTDEHLTHSDPDRKALALGKEAMGAMVLTLAMLARKEGWLTGERPGRRDPKAQELYDRMGWRHMSVVTEKDEDGKPLKTIPLQNIAEPLGGVIRMGAQVGDVFDALMDRVGAGDTTSEWVQNAGEYLAASGVVMTKLWQDQTFFSQTLRVFDRLSDGDGKAAGRFLAGYTPAMARELAEILEPATREANEWYEQIMAQVPGWRDDLATERNFLGETYVRGYGVFPEEAPPGYAELIERQINPLAAQGDFDSKWRPVWDFMAENLDMSVGLRKRRSIKGIDLTSEQTAAFMAIKGGETFESPDGFTIEPVRNPDDGKTMREALLGVVEDDRLALNVKREIFKSLVDAYDKIAVATLLGPGSPWPELVEKARLLQQFQQQRGGVR